MVFTPSRTAQIQVHNREERRAGSPDDQGEHRHEDTGRINETKTMCSITKSVGFRIPPARLQDIHKVGPPTGIPPTDSRSCDQSGTNIQHPVGKLQTQETSLEQNHSRTSSMRRFSEYSGDVPHCLNQRDDILSGGRDEEHREMLHENSNSTSKRPWHYIQQREMPVRKREDRVLWTHFYQRWIETVAGQGQSNQTVWST